MQDPTSSLTLPLLDLHPEASDFLADALSGLRAQPKRLSPKYFYDAQGSKLFDQICGLPEYYPTRTEIEILERYRSEISLSLGSQSCLIELGSGSSLKTSIVVASARDLHSYVPIDISKNHLVSAAERVAHRHPTLRVMPVCADFLGDLRLPEATESARRKYFWFPGSTIGNLSRSARQQLLETIVSLCQPQGGGLLIGIDLQKERDVLESAYNDRQGVTAAFNLNLLRRMNRELGANFELAQFRHWAFYNDAEGRIEMHLQSQRQQDVALADERFSFDVGESICTEHSYKFAVRGFADEADACGLSLIKVWTDPADLFAVMLLRC